MAMVVMVMVSEAESPSPTYVTVEPEFRVGVVVVSRPDLWKLPPSSTVKVLPQLKVLFVIANVPSTTLQVVPVVKLVDREADPPLLSTLKTPDIVPAFWVIV